MSGHKHSTHLTLYEILMKISFVVQITTQRISLIATLVDISMDISKNWLSMDIMDISKI